MLVVAVRMFAVLVFFFALVVGVVVVVLVVHPFFLFFVSFLFVAFGTPELDEDALDYACALLCRPGTTHVHVRHPGILCNCRPQYVDYRNVYIYRY